MKRGKLPSTLVFETERLFVREFTSEDAPAVFAYAGDMENCAFMSWAPESYEDVCSFINHRLATQIESPRRVYDLAVCLKTSGELIGSVGLYIDNEGSQAELGWIFNKRFWHCGYATEAARGFMRLGFLALDLHRIYAKCDDKNTASYRVMERLGMRREAHFIKDIRTKVMGREEWRSTYLYAMLQKEYLMTLFDGDHEPCLS